VAKTPQYPQPPPDPDLLAAVVLHTLVTEGRDGITAAHVAAACERAPDDRADMEEVEAALELLLDDGLAQRETRRTDAGKRAGADEDLFHPTRAAVRAAELSF
jgi:hypothetical protein